MTLFLDSLYEHRAQRIAADLWDARDEDGRLRDLNPTEEKFLTEIRQIGCDYTAVVGDARRVSESVALAVEFTARQRRQERYQAALDRYLVSKGEDCAESC